jgi:hypothetical protein
MAIRFDASADRLLRSNPDIGGADLYSGCMWVYRIGTPSPYGAIYTLNTNDAANNFNIDAVLVNSSNQLQTYVGDGIDSGFSGNGTTLTASTWFHLGWSNTSLGVNGFKLYVNGVLDLQNAYDRTGRTAAFTREETGMIYSANVYLFNGRVFNLMTFRGVLTAEHFKAQMRQFTPIFSPPILRTWTPMRNPGFRARHYDRIQGAYWTPGGTLTDEPNPGLTGSQIRRYWFVPIRIGALSGTVGQVTETDTAQAITRLKNKLLGQNTETDTAQAVTRVKIKVLEQAVETDSAQAMTSRKMKVVAQAEENDSAQPITLPGVTVVGQADEADLAQPITRVKVMQVMQVSETDLAQALFKTKRVAVVQVVETDLALPIANGGAIVFGIASVSNFALDIAALSDLPLETALLGDSAYEQALVEDEPL